MSQKVQELFKYDFEWELNDNPEFASQAGFHDFALKSTNKLQDVSPAGFAKRIAHHRDMERQATELIATVADQLTVDELKHLKIFEKQQKEVYDAMEHCKIYLMPVNSIGPGAGGVQHSFFDSIEWLRFEIQDDFKLYHDRLVAFCVQIDQFIEAFKQGLKENIIASFAMTRGIVAQIDAIADGPMDEFFAPIKNAKSELLSAELSQEITTAIEGVRGAYKKLKAFMVDEYLPHVLQVAGCHALPNGDVMYQYCLNYHTTTTLTADEIHEIGLHEVARIQKRFKEEVLLPLGFDPEDFEGFVKHVTNEKQFFVETSDELIASYNKMVKKVEPMLRNYFTEFPLQPLEIVSVKGGPAAFYIAGTVDGKRPGRFYVNTKFIEEQPLYEVEALTLHEAIPGHHHQTALNIENNKLPDFLRFIEDRRYDIAPCRRNMCTAYIEGWGLYSEYIGEEMGLYETPYSLFGRLSMEMMRAVRLVVDTGIHRKGWTMDQSIEYMMKMTGKHHNETEIEIYRYASWPGQACAYKIGEIEIRRLRKVAEAALGDKFDVKEFHTICLMNGTISLQMLGSLVDEYIAKKLA